jgi:hypothetical protein
LNKAERQHEKRAAAVQAELEDLEKKSQAEDARWKAGGRRGGWKRHCACTRLAVPDQQRIA